MARIKFKMLPQSTVSDSLGETFPSCSYSYPCAPMHINPQTHIGSQAFSLKEMNRTPAWLCVTKANED